MSEVYARPGSNHRPLSSKKIREMKKKALQSYQKISTIKEMSDKEKELSGANAEKDLDSFIKKS